MSMAEEFDVVLEVDTNRWKNLARQVKAEGKDPNAVLDAANERLSWIERVIMELRRDLLGALSIIGVTSDEIISWQIKRSEKEARRKNRV